MSGNCYELIKTILSFLPPTTIKEKKNKMNSTFMTKDEA